DGAARAARAGDYGPDRSTWEPPPESPRLRSKNWGGRHRKSRWMQRSRHRLSIGKPCAFIKIGRAIPPQYRGSQAVAGGDQDVLSRRGVPASSVYVALMTMAEIPSGIPIPFASHLLHGLGDREDVLSKTAARFK